MGSRNDARLIGQQVRKRDEFALFAQQVAEAIDDCHVAGGWIYSPKQVKQKVLSLADPGALAAHDAALVAELWDKLLAYCKSRGWDGAWAILQRDWDHFGGWK